MITRRKFLCRVGVGSIATAQLRAAVKPRELRITRIVVQDARGRRLTPVAPNAYAPYRGYEVREPILRLQTSSGLEGIAHARAKPELLKKLLGMDPFALFDWDGDVIRGPREEHKSLVDELYGIDVALLDLLGRAIGKPLARLLGQPVRERVPVYDSSLYMEDLLKPSERQDLAYIAHGPAPTTPAAWVARKARWILNRPEGIRILKIKIGREKWMGSFDGALERDIAVFQAVRREVGPDVVLFVDGNEGYKSRPLAAADFAEAVAGQNLYAMEEMFPETLLPQLREVKARLRKAGLKTKIADGENFVGQIPEKFRVERFESPNGTEPFFDIDQADMNASGFLRLRASAADAKKRGMTIAPHNFGSKMGLYAQVHLGLVTPNCEFCESDDTQIPALNPMGINIKNGIASLTGQAGLGVTLREERLELPQITLAL
jgi:L-alanine-DL-glutamate epimerase-like enolase superfamily enzyme